MEHVKDFGIALCLHELFYFQRSDFFKIGIYFTTNSCLPATGIELWPCWDELSQMMWTQNGRITCQVIKVVHNDSNKQVEHNKRAEKNKRDKIHIGHHWTAVLPRVQRFPSSCISLNIFWITFSASRCI